MKANQNKWSLEKTFNQLNDNYSELSFSKFWDNLNLEFYKKGLAKHRTYKSHFDIFNKYNSNVSFDDINYHFLCQFRDFKLYDNGKNFVASQEEKEKIKLYSPSGIHSILRSVRAVYNEAVNREVYEPKQYRSPFKGVFPKLSKTPNKSLDIQMLSKISKEIKNLPEKEINAILALIDHKTNVDMEKVLSRFDVFDSKLNSIKDSMKSEIISIKESVQSEIRSVNDKIMTTNDKIMTTRYLIIGLGLLITILSFVFKINS